MLFDASATDYIHGESIVTIGSYGLSRLAELAGLPLARGTFSTPLTSAALRYHPINHMPDASIRIQVRYLPKGECKNGRTKRCISDERLSATASATPCR